MVASRYKKRQDPENEVSLAAVGAELRQLVGMHCWFNGVFGICCSLVNLLLSWCLIGMHMRDWYKWKSRPPTLGIRCGFKTVQDLSLHHSSPSRVDGSGTSNYKHSGPPKIEVEESGIDDAIVEDHCDQILDQTLASTSSAVPRFFSRKS